MDEREKLHKLSTDELVALRDYLEAQIQRADIRDENNPQPRFSTRHGRLVVAPARSKTELQQEYLDKVQEELNRRRPPKK